MDVNTKLVLAENALREIAETMGRVCLEFELCHHPACADSCGAVLVALEYFNQTGESNERS